MQNPILTTLYAMHYFEGENSIPKNNLFWVFPEFDGRMDGTEKLLKYFLKEKTQKEINQTIKDFAIEHYPDIPGIKTMHPDEFEGAKIMGIQFYLTGDTTEDTKIKTNIADFLTESALHVLATSSGDDSYFDYDPIYAEYIISILKQLDTENAKSGIITIEKVLSERDV